MMTETTVVYRCGWLVILAFATSVDACLASILTIKEAMCTGVTAKTGVKKN